MHVCVFVYIYVCVYVCVFMCAHGYIYRAIAICNSRAACMHAWCHYMANYMQLMSSQILWLTIAM